MLVDLIRALCAAVVAVALPGYFWAAFLRPTCGLAERLAYSCALSMASVPVVALVLAHITRSGITLWIALASVGIVLGSGIVAVVIRGAAAGSAGAVFPSPSAIKDTRALVLLVVAFLAVLVSVAGGGQTPGWLVLPILALLILAGVLARTWVAPSTSVATTTPRLVPAPSPVPVTPGAATPIPDHPAPVPAADQEALTGRGQEARPAVTVLRASALAIVLALTAVRAYAPVIRYDWPSVRGLDHFSHTVMAEQMLAHGSYPTYLIYPPGFATISAVISRLSGVPPLVLFPVLAPALLVITALAAYALATRLWGRGYGIAAAALSGLVLNGAYAGFTDGRYPDLVGAYFLIPMGIAALLTLYESPSWRSVLLVAVLGAAPVFYHQVATLYEALILILAAVTSLPYLLYRRRRADARMVLFGLAAVTLLATCYAWYTYGLGWPVIRHSASSAAVSMVLGSQPVLPAHHLLRELAPPIVWLGVLGAVMLAMSLRYVRRPPQVLAAVTMLLWCLMMYLGSRTAADGFPQRFERDLGAALTVVGALGLGVILKSLWLALQRPKLTPAGVSSLALAIPLVAVGLQTARLARGEEHPARVLSPPVVAAGNWLYRHNSGGTIVSTVLNEGITERASLAISGYPGLQYYGRGPSTNARSLPPAGHQPLIDSQEVLEHPGSCAAANAITSEDVRYVLLYRGASQEFNLAAFRADPARYHEVFENRSVIIYAPTTGPCLK
jgi:hypothetical protein